MFRVIMTGIHWRIVYNGVLLNQKYETREDAENYVNQMKSNLTE